MTGYSLNEAEEVFNYVRNRQRNRQWRTPHVLTPGVTGWARPAQGDPQGTDGLRPLGAVRQELLAIVQQAGLRPTDQLIVEAWYELRQFPADLTGAGNSLTGRVASGRPRRPRRPLTSRAIGLRRSDAVKEVAAHLPRRPAATEQPYGPLPPAWLEPWSQPLAHADLERAYDVARHLLAVGSAEPSDSVSNLLHAELDELSRRIADGLDEVPQRLARANAALSIALWETRGLPAPRPRRPLSRSTLPPSLTRSAVEDGVRAAAPAEAAPLLRGYHDDFSLLAAVQSAAHPAMNPLIAWPILELCLTEADARTPMRAAGVVARVLYTVVQYARVQEDWRAVTLARQLIREHPTNLVTLNGCVAASVVAGAHLRFVEAMHLLKAAEELLADVVWLNNRTIELAEWAFLVRLARSAVLRRAAEHAVGAGATDPYSSKALELASGCAQDARSIPGFDGQHSDGGDADAGYLALPLLRTAELEDLAAHKLAIAAGSRPDRPTALALSRARGMSAAALDLAAGERILANADFAVLAAKLGLRLAVIEGNQEEAVAASNALQDRGWPLERSVLPVFLALKESRTGQPQTGLTDSMRRAAAAALAVGPAKDGEQARPTRVPAGYRRSQLNAFGSGTS